MKANALSRLADQALRGINIESARPDFFFIDDPQTEDDEVIRTTRDFTRVRGNATGLASSWKIGCSLAGPVAVTIEKKEGSDK